VGPEFWQTIMGRTLIEATLPRIARSLERIAVALEKANETPAPRPLPEPPEAA